MANANGRQNDDVALSRSDRARSLQSLHAVEKHADAPGPTRPNEWRDDLLIVLDDLASSLHGQYERSASEDGLLSRVIEEAPQLGPAVQFLRKRQTELIADVDEVRQTLADLSRTPDVNAMRTRISELTSEIHELRAWETDIVYDAYAFDLGTGD